MNFQELIRSIDFSQVAAIASVIVSAFALIKSSTNAITGLRAAYLSTLMPEKIEVAKKFSDVYYRYLHQDAGFDEFLQVLFQVKMFYCSVTSIDRAISDADYCNDLQKTLCSAYNTSVSDSLYARQSSFRDNIRCVEEEIQQEMQMPLQKYSVLRSWLHRVSYHPLAEVPLQPRYKPRRTKQPKRAKTKRR